MRFMAACRDGTQASLGYAPAVRHSVDELIRGVPVAEPRNRYSTVSLILHWLIAALVLTQVLLITARESSHGPVARQLLDLHKSVGMGVLILTVLRILWRMMNPAIPLPAAMPRWETLLARTTQVLFYVALLALPLTGWAAMSAMGRDVSWFGLFNWPLLPVEGGRAVGRTLLDVHGWVVKGVYVLLALHVIGALKHQFIDRDNVLHRMIPLIPRRP